MWNHSSNEISNSLSSFFISFYNFLINEAREKMAYSNIRFFAYNLLTREGC